MSQPRLRVIQPPEEAATGHVSVRLCDIGPLLADAYCCDRTWLKDFKNQRIRISADLYDVICAYRNARPSA